MPTALNFLYNFGASTAGRGMILNFPKLPLLHKALVLTALPSPLPCLQIGAWSACMGESPVGYASRSVKCVQAQGRSSAGGVGATGTTSVGGATGWLAG